MVPPGEQLAQQILDDLACPQCEYNLRGLRGPIVQCPECGCHSNIPKLIAEKWTRPWWEAPGFNRLVTPLAFLVLSACGLFIALGVEIGGMNGRGGFTALLAMIVFMVWVILLNWAGRQFEDERGITLVAFLHVLFVGYLFGVLGIIMMAIRAMRSGSWIEAAIVLPLIVVLAALLVYCRKGERYVAEQCMKRYLRMTDAATGKGVPS